MFVTMLSSLVVALQLALLVALVTKYLRTRDAGFVWLGVALIVWPLASWLLNWGVRVQINSSLRGHRAGFFPFTLIQSGEVTPGEFAMSFTLLDRTISVALLLIAVLVLARRKHEARAADAQVETGS